MVLGDRSSNGLPRISESALFRYVKGPCIQIVRSGLRLFISSSVRTSERVGELHAAGEESNIYLRTK